MVAKVSKASPLILCKLDSAVWPIVNGSRFLSMLVCSRSFRIHLVGVLVAM